MEERRRADVTRSILVFLVIVLSIGMVFEMRVSLDLHRMVVRLEEAAHPDPLLRTAGMPSPFEALDQTCTRCHTERRFSGADLTGGEANQLLARMERHPDLGIEPDKWAKLQSALILQRCLVCHEEPAVQAFLAMSPYMRHGMVDHMIHSSGSTITRSDTEEILLAANRLSLQ